MFVKGKARESTENVILLNKFKKIIDMKETFLQITEVSVSLLKLGVFFFEILSCNTNFRGIDLWKPFRFILS